MTDLEMIKRCAETSGIEVFEHADQLWCNFRNVGNQVYNPLTNDAQAMALVKKFTMLLMIDYDAAENEIWSVTAWNGNAGEWTRHYKNADLNRAIVECVAGVV